MSISKEELDKLLKEKGVEPNMWAETPEGSPNNLYNQKQVQLLQGLKSVIDQQLIKDKSLLNELNVKKSKITKKK